MTKYDGQVKCPRSVIPAQAGIHNELKSLDSRLRGNDKKKAILTFYETIKYCSRIILFAILPILFLCVIAASVDAATTQSNRFHSYLKQGIDNGEGTAKVEARKYLQTPYVPAKII